MSSLKQIRCKSVKGFMSYDRAYKQTNSLVYSHNDSNEMKMGLNLEYLKSTDNLYPTLPSIFFLQRLPEQNSYDLLINISIFFTFD